ncbi:TPA: hypothetical protein L3467_003807 [Escherichia coli]|nr:hypothetical protein [Escherichia coli]
MAERVDDAELSMNQLEALKDMAIDNIRKQAQVVSQVFTGKCRYCNECNFAFFSGLIGAQFWAERVQPKSPELDAKLLVSC